MDTTDLNPYEILNLTPNSPKIDIKRAYRRMAMEYHPDHNANNPESEEIFKKIQWAYEELTDEKKKKKEYPKPVRTRPHPPSFFKNKDPLMSFIYTMMERQRYKKHFESTKAKQSTD
ncbi:MAG: DnaJ domain-containing protein [Desulfobacterales bacterium]|nr:DnaJ domain-containing protein [Desulfobacterales bacterium]